MADINLIGNDSGASDKRGRKDDHYEEPVDFGQSSYETGSFGSIPDTDYGTRDPYMDQTYAKKGSKGIMYVLIGACVILFVLLIYLLMSGDEDKSDQGKDGAQGQAQTTEAVPPPLHGPNQEILNNLDAIINSFPQNLKLSVFRYSRGEFIIETHSKSNDVFDELNNRLRQALQSGQIKESKKVRSAVSGYRVGLLSGLVPQADIWAQPDKLMGLSYIGESELRTRIQNYCNSTNMKLKEYNVGRTKAENNFRKTMIKVKVIGNKNDATRFLKTLNDEKINVSFSKIVFLASEPALDSQLVNLILEIELFRKVA